MHDYLDMTEAEAREQVRAIAESMTMCRINLAKSLGHKVPWDTNTDYKTLLCALRDIALRMKEIEDDVWVLTEKPKEKKMIPFMYISEDKP